MLKKIGYLRKLVLMFFFSTQWPFFKSFYSTVQKKCKRNSVFFVLCSRENSAKFRYEFSSKRSRIFLESNEISPLSWRNLAIAKIRTREISRGRKFALAIFPQSEISLEKEAGCNENSC